MITVLTVLKEDITMTEKNTSTAKPVEKLTDEALERVTGGVDIEEVSGKFTINENYQRNYLFCLTCRDYRRLILLDGKQVCEICKNEIGY